MLLDIAVQATRIVLTSFIFLGTVGNILSLLIFTRRTLLLATRNHNFRRIDGHMMRMLFPQVLTQLLCVLPFAILSLLSLCINNTTTIYNFFSQMLILPLFVSYTTSFYVFTLSSRVYRQELMKIIGLRKCRQGANELTIRTITTTEIRQHRKRNTINLQKQ